MSPFGGSVDEFQVDLLKSNSFSVNQQRFSESDEPLAGSHNTALQHQEVLVDLTVMMESALKEKLLKNYWLTLLKLTLILTDRCKNHHTKIKLG